jgi:hypothetical protein
MTAILTQPLRRTSINTNPVRKKKKKKEPESPAQRAAKEPGASAHSVQRARERAQDVACSMAWADDQWNYDLNHDARRFWGTNKTRCGGRVPRFKCGCGRHTPPQDFVTVFERQKRRPLRLLRVRMPEWMDRLRRMGRFVRGHPRLGSILRAAGRNFSKLPRWRTIRYPLCTDCRTKVWPAPAENETTIIRVMKYMGESFEKDNEGPISQEFIYMDAKDVPEVVPETIDPDAEYLKELAERPLADRQASVLLQNDSRIND